MDSLLWNRFPCFATSQKPEILCALPSLSSRKTRHFYNPAFIVRANKRFSARRFSVRRPTAAFRSGYCRVWLDCHVAQTCRNTHVPHRGCRTFWRELSSRLACQDIPIRQSVRMLCRVRRWTDGADSRRNSDSTLPTCPITTRSVGDSTHTVKSPGRCDCVR